MRIAHGRSGSNLGGRMTGKVELPREGGSLREEESVRSSELWNDVENKAQDPRFVKHGDTFFLPYDPSSALHGTVRE